ncbi:MAG: UPF0149 family protein [Rhodanobacteraceae bacterium]|nr:UPF0149 family protein [Rhodanobacteraceae bacterium]
MTELLETDPPSPLAPLFTPEEADELSELMLSFDGGMLDFGELDGFLSALAVAPQPTTLERWWGALFGPEPEWEADHEPARARALIERYYAMVQARVALDPYELGPEAVPPLESSFADEDDGYEDDDPDFDPDAAVPEDNDIAEVDDDSDDDNPYAEGGPLDDGDEDEDEDAFDDPTSDSDDDDIADIGSDDEPEFIGADDEEDFGDGEDFDFAFAETWLSGFRYALSLQADDWRRAIDAEPPLARWLYALWTAADDAQGAEGPLDALPAMAPSAAAPEDAGFLALEAALREKAASQPLVEPLDENRLIGLIPVLLHQLWRRHREQAQEVSAQIEIDLADGLANQKYAEADHLAELLQQHAVPAGGMNLEFLDGFWSAQRAAMLEVSPFDSLVRILGPDKVWEDVEDAREVMMALMGYWNAISERLSRKAEPTDPLCHPFIDFPIDGDPADHPERPYGQDFAKGFLAAIEDFPRSAKLLLMDPQAKHWLAPFEALAKGHSLEKRLSRLGFEERMGLIAELPECIAELGIFWTASGGAIAREPKRVEALPGRNDPCPCGSGKKYKKCHGAPERLN